MLREKVSKHPHNAQHPSLPLMLILQHPVAREKKKFLYESLGLYTSTKTIYEHSRANIIAKEISDFSPVFHFASNCSFSERRETRSEKGTEQKKKVK